MGRRCEGLLHAFRVEPESTGEPVTPSPFQDEVLPGITGDPHTPMASGALFGQSREMTRRRDDVHSFAAAQDCLRHLGSILGLTFQEREASLNVDATSYNAILQDLRAKIAETGENELAELVPDPDMEAVSAPDIDRLVDIRTTCRSYKQYENRRA
mgnify:CR=1 FL=1